MAQPSDHSDPFAPPRTPCEVQCIHCGESYESWRIEWRDATAPSEFSSAGFWCCPTPGCDGIGFGFDIFPVDPKWTDERGEPLCTFFTDDEEAEDEAISCEPDFTDEEMAAMELDDVADDAEDEDEDDDNPFGLPVDVFDADAFWIDLDSLLRRPMGNVPQPPFDAMAPDKKSWPTYGPDDIPF